MLHPFITLLWVKKFTEQIMHHEAYHSFAPVLIAAVMPYCGLKQCVPTLFRVGYIFPIGPKLRPSVLGAVLHVQKWSWIGFLRVHFLPSFWPLPLPDYSFVQLRTYHDISLGQNQQIFLVWSKKIINERKKKEQALKKKYYLSISKMKCFDWGARDRKKLARCLQKQNPNYLIYTLNHQETRQRGNSTATARCADVRLYIFRGTAEGLPEVEVHSAEDLP